MTRPTRPIRAAVVALALLSPLACGASGQGPGGPPPGPGALVDAALALYPGASVAVEPLPDGFRLVVRAAGGPTPPMPAPPKPTPDPGPAPPDKWSDAVESLAAGLVGADRTRWLGALTSGLLAVDATAADPDPMRRQLVATPQGVGSLLMTSILDALDDATRDDLTRAARAGDLVIRAPDGPTAVLWARMLKVRADEALAARIQEIARGQG